MAIRCTLSGKIGTCGRSTSLHPSWRCPRTVLRTGRMGASYRPLPPLMFTQASTGGALVVVRAAPWGGRSLPGEPGDSDGGYVAVAIDPMGRFLAAAGANKSIRVVDAHTGQFVTTSASGAAAVGMHDDVRSRRCYSVVVGRRDMTQSRLRTPRASAASSSPPTASM